MGRKPNKKSANSKNFSINSKYAIYGVIGLLIASLGLNAYLFNQKNSINSSDKNILIVKRVVDGDTIEIENGPYIRLASAQSPEKGNCYFEEAKDYLATLVEGNAVEIEFESMGSYGRPNAYIYVDGNLVNKLMIQEGYGRYEGREKSSSLGMQQAYEDAKTNKKGLWGACVSTKNAKEGCLIKGNVTINTDEKTYLFPGCSNYDRTEVDLDKGEDWFCSEKQAQDAGFVKSGSCYGKDY